eukprot:gene17059-biopygen20337
MQHLCASFPARVPLTPFPHCQECTKVWPEAVVGKLGQPPVPSAPSARRAARRVGADARREGRVCALGCAPEIQESF